MAAPSTTDAFQIKDIRDGVVVLKDGSMRGIVQIDAINFELRSSDEQAGILEQFQGFLNAIDFPLQVVIHSRKYNVQTYLAGIQEATDKLDNELLKLQGQEYIRFIGELSDLANIMSKRFYVVIAVQVTPSAQTAGFLSGITGLFGKKKAAPTTTPEQEFDTYKIELQQRADLILGGLSGMGLKGKMLGQDDVVTLFTDLYNPTVPAKKAPASTAPHA